ncbi:hypothetical protein LOTGIDRAFT_235647 [Lottia gigantea]|uniref:Thyroglobulin type-1 domain-containing protein n=1 Tax=Lottia gigantea TaxID=225164 RepID=V3ZYK8_LOTGI|nr:hypothetical protein LOTGIDRAFT_235647 [Lottia gigantea]ESO86071.1 hypothetical protein LOTGIDRAFT_235647 [Lottia gigantea]
MLFVVVLLAAIASTQAIVCAPFLCNGATFDATQCKGGVIKDGGFCRCTDACAKVEGEMCQLERAIFGGVPLGDCDNGLKCTSGSDGHNPFGRGVCAKDVTKRSVGSSRTECEQKRISAMISMAIWQGKWTPRCDTDGNFFPHQCDNTGSCFCVEKISGKILTTKSRDNVPC